MPAIFGSKPNTLDSEQIEIPDEEFDEFAPNEVILLKQQQQLNTNSSPSKTPDTTGLGITTQSMGSTYDGQIPLYRLQMLKLVPTLSSLPVNQIDLIDEPTPMAANRKHGQHSMGNVNFNDNNAA